MRTASASARLLKAFSSLNHPTVPLATRPSLLPRVSSPRANILHTQTRLFDEWGAYELPRTPLGRSSQNAPSENCLGAKDWSTPKLKYAARGR